MKYALHFEVYLSHLHRFLTLLLLTHLFSPLLNWNCTALNYTLTSVVSRREAR